ncbi:glycosyltransferase [Shewanella baltica]|uniref:glycosyltransferase n=1 Tax=Shewanella baltica TaxID=62322 RepID=UPI003D039ABF
MPSIIFFIYSLQESNGTERAVINLANSFPSEYKVKIISLVKQHRLPLFPVNDNTDLSDLGITFNSKLLVYLFAFFKMIFVFFFNKRSEDKVTIIGTLVYINIILSFFSIFKSKCKFYGWEHAPYEHPVILVRVLRRWFYRFLDDVICINNHEKNKFINADCINVKVVPNIVFVNEIPFISREDKINNKELLFVGRFSHEKGIDLLLDVLDRFFNFPPSIQYTVNVLGDGELLSSAKDKIKNTSYSGNVRFLGKSSNVETFYNRSLLLLCTSRYESFGLVIVEAMSFGTPTISFDIGSGPSTIIKNKNNGFLVDAFSIDDYVAVMKDFLFDIDTEMHVKIYSNCIATFEQYSIKNILPIWMAILKC